MGVELELGILYLTQTLGQSFFDSFEVETPGWRKALKWLIVGGLTVALYFQVGHWALLLPLAGGVVGSTFHVIWCRKNGIDPWKATPRRKYWELRGWEWTE